MALTKPEPSHALEESSVQTKAVTRVALTGLVTAPWHLGGGLVPAPGTRVHLMLQGHTRGLVGRGIVRSAPFRAGPADRPGTLAHCRRGAADVYHLRNGSGRCLSHRQTRCPRAAPL